MTSQLPPPTPPSPTGITDALAGLQDLDELPTADHVERLRAVHDSLTAALSSIDEV
ncbi:MAG: hypothetical protein M3460_08580 [Actinomycetota bacterium]|nr:hypothetical protein [Actinomycetota bacterium]